MADFATMPDGSLDDRVRVVFGGTETHIFESYTVKMSVLQQPAAFSVRLGDSGTAKGIMEAVPPNTPFQLLIGATPQFTGYTDGYSATDSSGTSVTVMGRDVLARLHDAFVDKERSFVDISHAEVVTEALNDVGLTDALLFYTNADNQDIRAGVDVFTTEVKQSGGAILRHTVHAKLGERWLDFLTRHLEKVGLFIWADANGNIVLAAPNKDQKPLYRFERKRGQLRNQVNVISAELKNDTTKRASEVVVYARAGGRRSGRGKLHGTFVDTEMAALGFKRRVTYRDVNVMDEKQAEKYARHKIAEMNRAGWSLTYTLQGHTAPAKKGGRAVIVPDTMAEVEDDELGLSGTYYVEAVEHRAPPTTTVVTLMRPQDLVWEPDPTIVEQVIKANAGRKRRKRR